MSKTKAIKETRLWTATWDNSVKRFRVRRVVYFKDGSKKLENRPHAEYKELDKDKKEIEEYLEIINYRELQEEKAKKSFKVRSAFIKNKDTNKVFEEWMFSRTGNDIYSRNVASTIRRYLIGYFHDKKKNYDYKTWESLGEQAEFVEFLKSKKLANKTIITIKNNSNMFFQFLHEKSKGKIELMKFTFPSLTRAGVRRYEKERKKRLKNKDKRLSGEDYISEEDFKLIYNYCIKTTPSDDEERYRKIAPYIFMCYHYGLRRSEVMALKTECLKNEYLIITEQLKKIGEYGELKHGAEERKIPHTFTEEKLTTVAGMIKLISETKMHPTTYTNRFSEVMEALNKKYTIHNIRNTYISNCFAPKYGLSLTDVMFFAGHKSVRTTEGYIRNRKKWEAEQTLDLDEYLDDFTLDKAV